MTELEWLSQKATQGPWFLGDWSGQCHKKHKHGTAEDPCVFDPIRNENDRAVSNEGGVTVLGSSYDGLEAKREDLVFIAELVNAFRSGRLIDKDHAK